MLTDFEGKLLRILHNYSTVHHHMPSYHLLRAKTGRKDEGIDQALTSLAQKGLIEWNRGLPLMLVVIIRNPYEQKPSWWHEL